MKIHLLSWDEICKPNEHGGLGLKKDKVPGMSPPSAGVGEDRITWGIKRDGRFRICSAYLLAAEDEGGTLELIWRLIKRWRGPQQI
ncbi:hypothetical protein LINPERHAP2_LOCUS3289 [Linum perenne]